MTPEELEQIGIAMYGENWKSPLSAALRAEFGWPAHRTLQRWANGQNEIPKGFREIIYTQAYRRSDELANRARQIREAMEELRKGFADG